MNQSQVNRLSAAGVLITLGIVFGDIGTSPLYVLSAVIGKQAITSKLILGALSCIVWTLTFQTTLKYVIITLRADNKGEGGILSLYALVRRRAKWLVVPAVIGASSLLADGFITPPISVTSAIEGIKILNPHIYVVPIVLLIIFLMFMFQRFGTQVVGKFFGPVMVIWFTTLAVLGFSQVLSNPAVFKALNPAYAYNFLLHYPGGFWLLGAVFLCTTGAEALYSDLGHCGRQNIQVSWIFVKTCLLLNYFGQGAWLLLHQGATLNGRNPFYFIMPEWFLIPGIIIATSATIIASQALITGSFTLISEAIRLNIWPKTRLIFPTTQKGQMYIPSINWMLCFGCIIIVLYFKEAARMEAAYGLAITITMLMTTILLLFYLRVQKLNIFFAGFLGLIFLSIEAAFLVANLIKFPHGGWVALLIGGFLVSIMFVWFKSRKIKNRYIEFTKLDKHLPILKELSEDDSVPKFATNLVYLTSADYPNEIETKIIYSIFNKQPKRAEIYWFIHVDILDEPHAMEYDVRVLVPEKVYKIDFSLGFREDPKINLFFRKVVEDMSLNNEVNIMSRYKSLKNHHIVGDFRFVVIDRVLNYDYDLRAFEQFIMAAYSILKRLSLSEEKAFGLDTSSVTTETVPLITIPPSEIIELELIRAKRV